LSWRFTAEVGRTTDISPFKAFKELKVIAAKIFPELYLNAWTLTFCEFNLMPLYREAITVTSLCTITRTGVSLPPSVKGFYLEILAYCQSL